MQILKCKKPKGYLSTNIHFPNPKFAEVFIDTLKKDFLTKKAQSLEMDLSKRKRKNIMFSKSKKYVLTKQGSSFLLWESS